MASVNVSGGPIEDYDPAEEIRLLRNKVAFLINTRDQLKIELEAAQERTKAAHVRRSHILHKYNLLLNKQPTKKKPKGRAIKVNNKKGKP